jgi:plasmid maintenance system antidote protein VapI
MNEIEKLLTEKYGKVRGSQSKLARDLGTEQSVIANWIAGRSDIGVDYIVKLSKIFNKTEEKIKDIFGVKHKVHLSAYNVKNNKGEINKIIMSSELVKKDLEIMQGEIKSHGTKLEMLNLKLDLILEKLKKGERK